MNYQTIKTDALIIGSGLSGLLAAKQITQNSPQSKITMLGDGWGASPYVHGFNMPLREDDSIELFLNDTLKSGRYQSISELANALCNGTEDVKKELCELGINFDRAPDGSYKLLRPLGASVPRVASVGNHTGIEIMKKVRAILAANENFTHCRARALRLFTDHNRVCGALVYDKETKEFTLIQSKLTILCTGGFCNIYPFSTNKSDIGGDGIAMAYYGGASLTDLEFVQFEPSAAVAPKKLRGQSVITTMYYEGAVLKNTLGERFMLKHSDAGECVDKDVQAKCIYREIKEGRATENGGVFFDATGVGREKLNEMYSSYVKRYKNVGIDIAETPFEIAPAPHTSLGGVVINGSCETELDGLFACGEMIGGLHGANRAGGNAGLETLVFGTIAGKSSCSYLDSHKDEYVPSKLHCDNFVNSVICRVSNETMPGADELSSMRRALDLILESKLSVLRVGTELNEAKDELETMLRRLECANTDLASPEQLYSFIRLENDLTTAYLLCLSCIERDMSIGCHVRVDCADGTDSPDKYRVNVRYSKNGACVKKVAIR